MPNLKVTKAKVRNHCPLCDGEVVDNQWPEHLMRCTGGKFPCKTCGKLFKKKEYLIRHEKKFHGKESVNQNDNGVDSGDEGWLTQDPGDLLGQVSSTDDSSSDEGVESCEENSEGIKEQSQVASNEDKGESEKEKHSAKPESRSPLEKGRVVRKRTEPAPVFAPRGQHHWFQPKAAGSAHLPFRSSVSERRTSRRAHRRRISLVMDKREF